MGQFVGELCKNCGFYICRFIIKHRPLLIPFLAEDVARYIAACNAIPSANRAGHISALNASAC